MEVIIWVPDTNASEQGVAKIFFNKKGDHTHVRAQPPKLHSPVFLALAGRRGAAFSMINLARATSF
jgi:hypothetical protein